MKQFTLLFSGMVLFSHLTMAQNTTPAQVPVRPVAKTREIKEMPAKPAAGAPAAAPAKTIKATKTAAPAPAVKPSNNTATKAAAPANSGNTTAVKAAPTVSNTPAQATAKPTTTPKGPIYEQIPSNPTAPASSAEIAFVTTNHDFGTVEEGVEATYDFEFTNTGKDSLKLTNVHASCGCTTPSWPHEAILPGQKSKITATYHTQGRPGAFSKTIFVTTNSKTPEIQLVITGTVNHVSPVETEKKPNEVQMAIPEKK